MYYEGYVFYYDKETYNLIAEYCNKNNLVIEYLGKDDIGDKYEIKSSITPSLTEEQILEEIRFKREKICFTYINRGVLWYNTLTSEQQQELNTWYKDWLNVPQAYQETKPTDIETIIPTKPSWLN